MSITAHAASVKPFRPPKRRRLSGDSLTRLQQLAGRAASLDARLYARLRDLHAGLRSTPSDDIVLPNGELRGRMTHPTAVPPVEAGDLASRRSALNHLCEKLANELEEFLTAE